MMKKIHTLLCFLFFFFLSNAQERPIRAVVEFHAQQPGHVVAGGVGEGTAGFATMMAPMPLLPADPFLAFSVVWYSEGTVGAIGKMRILFFDETSGVHEQEIVPDPHVLPEGNRHVSHLYFLEKEALTFQLVHAGEGKIDSMAVHFYNPGHTVPTAAPPHSPFVRSACACPMPAYQDRDDWCPAGNCPPNPSPTATNVGHLIVHHSAGTNSASDWAAVVRAIWDFHVNVNGWSDIGYNWLVDPNGVLYEGRGDNVLGAHFCGTNGGTMGVCVLGDFTNITPNGSAVNTLQELLAWKCCDKELDPLGTGLHTSSGKVIDRISGHRDGCATSCPGNMFYPLLPGIRQWVNAYIENDCEAPLLAAPVQLVANLVANNEIALTWQDDNEFETGYVLERSVGNNNDFEPIASLPANTFEHSDFDLLPVTTYYYRVQAVLGNTSSPFSNEASAATGATATGDQGSGNAEVRIYPNPTAGRFTLFIENKWLGQVEVAAFDATGKQVAPVLFFEKKEPASRFDVAWEALPAGVFWLKMKHGEEERFVKMIKQ